MAPNDTPDPQVLPASSEAEHPATPQPRSTRGFASMDPERQRLIAARGGRAAHASGNAHQFSGEQARDAGRKGGRASGANRSRNTDPAPRGNG